MVSQVSAECSRQLRHEAQRLEILEAAAAAIAEHGFHGMTMRGLARATGRGLATFYDYFPSKEEVLFSLQSDAFQTMTRSVQTALAGVDEQVDRLYVFVLNHLRFSVEHRSVMQVLVHEASALPAGRRKTVRLLKEGYFKICRDIVAAIIACGGKAPGGLDLAEVERVTYSVFGMLNWSYGWYDPRHHGSPQDVAKTIHTLAVSALVAPCPRPIAQGKLQRDLNAIAPQPLVGRPDRGLAAAKKRLSPAEKNVKRARPTDRMQSERGLEKCGTEK